MKYNKMILWLIPVVSIVAWMTLYPFRKTEITAKEARDNLQKGQYDYIVDVRTEKEWSEDHLPYAISIPIGSLVTDLPIKIPDRSARILFVCKKGIRASAVIVIAHKLGYKNIQSMIGNFRELME